MAFGRHSSVRLFPQSANIQDDSGEAYLQLFSEETHSFEDQYEQNTGVVWCSSFAIER